MIREFLSEYAVCPQAGEKRQLCVREVEPALERAHRRVVGAQVKGLRCLACIEWPCTCGCGTCRLARESSESLG